ncbi:eukaryotic translation initiation factor 3B-2 [Raphanus sativus]|uniref:Eukaryotic translation initiation factor 3 subunit B-like isoform X1 n=1 Tax=Raphanus sativus TaxID=3726 RepID=A0A6J0MZA2_RAPSA|nr:eukaryotic translation initiation factor 3 subunit B-like isoform X1 [Raphanus sativus]XP_056863838.1 eukaryotic translation initiation factor 3 subunit B-like isoform X1 [Raphanus sativus]KAJ4901183.1 eukaryotic translation initiation factor 3B-2 [Raphanus sativus]
MVKLAEKDLTAVVGSDCKMHWQSNGEYLAVNTYGGFEFFRIKEEEGTPTDFLKVDKEILAFAWEPSGHRFAVIYDEPNLLSAVSFYSMKKPGKVTELTSLSNKQADALFWSPKGNLIVLAGLKAGKLEFYDVDRLVAISSVETVNANKVVWNPSGSYIATVSTMPEEDYNRHCDCEQNDPLNGFNIWSSQGKLLCKHQFDSPLLQPAV